MGTTTHSSHVGPNSWPRACVRSHTCAVHESLLGDALRNAQSSAALAILGMASVVSDADLVVDLDDAGLPIASVGVGSLQASSIS